VFVVGVCCAYSVYTPDDLKEEIKIKILYTHQCIGIDIILLKEHTYIESI